MYIVISPQVASAPRAADWPGIDCGYARLAGGGITVAVQRASAAMRYAEGMRFARLLLT